MAHTLQWHRRLSTCLLIFLWVWISHLAQYYMGRGGSNLYKSRAGICGLRGPGLWCGVKTQTLIGPSPVHRNPCPKGLMASHSQRTTKDLISTLTTENHLDACSPGMRWWNLFICHLRNCLERLMLLLSVIPVIMVVTMTMSMTMVLKTCDDEDNGADNGACNILTWQILSSGCSRTVELSIRSGWWF